MRVTVGRSGPEPVAAPAVDVLVVGAGPAGAVAARQLARAGRSVLLVDPRLDDPSPGGFEAWKPGDALAGAATRLLRALDLPPLAPAGPHRPIGGTVSAWGRAEPDRRDFFMEPDGPAWRLDRRRFEADLVAAAVGSGVRVLAATARSPDRTATGWRLRLTPTGGGTDRPVTARWLVDASGRAAGPARRLGALRHRDAPLLAVAALAAPDPAHRTDRSLVETVPEGWWYAARLPEGETVFILHTDAEDGAGMLADPARWLAALGRTRLLRETFPQPRFSRDPRGFEACGAWLEPAWGPGWIACGDAALSFDPCAGQGVFSALHGGMDAARALLAAESGDGTAMPAYAARLAEIRRIYRQRVVAHYARERRWPDAPFWRARNRAEVERPAESAPAIAAGTPPPPS